AQCLVVVRLVFCGALKKRGCPLELSLRDAGTGIEVMSLERIGIKRGCLFEFRDCFLMLLPEREREPSGSMCFGESIVQSQRLRAGGQNAVDASFQMIMQE